MMKSLSILLASFVSFIAVTVVAQAPGSFYIESLTYAGSGCPQGSVAISVSNDRTVFTAIFDDFVASIGPNIPNTANRRNCQINAKLHYPGGFQFAIGTVDYRGYASLDSGVSGEHVSNYYFSGQSQQVGSTVKFNGGTRRDYLIRDTLAFLYYSSCSGTDMFNANTQVRLFGSGNGVLTNDSVDGKVSHIFGLRWRRCQ